MNHTKSISVRRIFAVLMSLLIILASVPVSLMMEEQDAFAADGTISVKLHKGSTLMKYGGSGLAYKYTVTVNGTTRMAYCLQPSEVPPDVGTRKAGAMSDSSKVAQLMYYCYGYPGQKKLASWLKDNGYSSFASGNKFYCLCHVMLSYAYDPDKAFVGWSGGKACTTINKSYRTMVKKAYNYVKTLEDPAGFASEISFSSESGSTAEASWTADGEFKSQDITLEGHEDNYVTYTVPEDMTLHMEDGEYAAGTKVTINCGSSFYFTSTSMALANTTYTSPALKGNLQDYTAYKITDSGSQNLAFFAVDKADTASFEIKFGPAAAKIKVVKVDAETGKAIPQEGAMFDIFNSDGDTVCDDIKTDSKGEATSMELVPGTYYVQEVQAPSGYVIATDKEEVTITNSDCAAGTVTFTKEDSPQKGIINIEKYGDYINSKGDKDEELLENIKFRILAAEDIYSGDKVTKYYSKGDLVQDDLITDEKGKVSSKELPLGSYTVVEVGAYDRNTGEAIENYRYHITEGENEKSVTLTAADQTVKVVYGDVQIRNNSIPEIGTTAKDSATGDSQGQCSEKATIIDTVKYERLEPGREYTLKGTLMDAATGKALLIDGEEVRAEKTFTPKSYNGSVDMEFTFDSTKAAGKSIVVFEDLYRDKAKVATHSDITDKGQTITYPELKTTAKDAVTDSHVGESSETEVIIDTVSYSNLIAGKEYTVKGRLMNKDTGEVITQNGKEITSQLTFTAEKSDGTIEMRFEVDSTALNGATVVVFEDLYRNNIKVAAHADLTDKDQSIGYPAISTTAKDSQTGDNQGHLAKSVTIIDTVKYENLEAGKDYTIKGTLMDKTSGEPLEQEGQAVTAEQTFTPDQSSGTIDMTFTLDSEALAGTSTVVFESLYTDGVELASHTDLTDEGQSLHWPAIKTKAADTKTDSNTGALSRFDRIIDTVSYTDLIPGNEYTVKGLLMDKATGEALKINGKEITAESTFIAKAADGTVELTFYLDSRELYQKSIVAFEDLYHNDIDIAVHADINDADQTITYPEKPDTPKTGDSAHLLLYGGLAGAAAAALALMAIRRRRKGRSAGDEE